MEKTNIYELHARLCDAFTSSKRLEILNLLRDRELSVGEISRLADIRQANLSQHLGILRSRGVVSTRRVGATVFYSVSNPKIIRAFDLLAEVLLEDLTEAGRLSKDLEEKRMERSEKAGLEG